jgi:Tfp pilus assembly protein PilP
MSRLVVFVVVVVVVVVCGQMAAGQDWRQWIEQRQQQKQAEAQQQQKQEQEEAQKVRALHILSVTRNIHATTDF